jgi:hypothetical protein
MGMSSRTVFELHCDVQVCASVIRGPSHQAVMDLALGVGGWGQNVVQLGHGTTEIFWRCPNHGNVEPT